MDDMIQLSEDILNIRQTFWEIVVEVTNTAMKDEIAAELTNTFSIAIIDSYEELRDNGRYFVFVISEE